jgi:hypothetical protein
LRHFQRRRLQPVDEAARGHDAQASFCIINSIYSIFKSLIIFLTFPYRNVLGTKNLGDILSEREIIANMMQTTLDEATDPWGVKVERVEV